MTFEFTRRVDPRDERAVGKLIASGHDGFRPTMHLSEICGMGQGISDEFGMTKVSTVAGGIVRRQVAADNDDYGPQTIKFFGNGRWQWHFNNRCIFEVVHGMPQFLTDQLDRDEFKAVVQNCFQDADIDRLWAAVLSVKQANHGAILIIDSEASLEVNHAPIGFPVCPTTPSADALQSICSIDGAVLLTTNAEVVGYGLILDGQSRPNLGDVSRGARYNATLRYVHARRRNSCAAIGIVYSEDGMINILIPRLVDFLARPFRTQSLADKCPVDILDLDREIVESLVKEGLSTAGQLALIPQEIYIEYLGASTASQIDKLLEDRNSKKS